MPKISIILPIYNVEKYLKRCIDSILAQTLEDIEVILATDGPEACDKICEDYANKDPRVKVIMHPGSYGKAFNEGLKAATGEYIGIVETDDWCDVTMFEKLYNKAKENNADVVKAGFYSAFDNPEQNVTELYDGYDEDFCLSKQANFLGSQPSVWSCVYKRDFLIKNNIYMVEERLPFIDVPFHYETLYRAQKYLLLKEPLYYYYQGNPNQTVNNVKPLAGLTTERYAYSKFLNEGDLWDKLKEGFIFATTCHFEWNYSKIAKEELKTFWNAVHEFLNTIPLKDVKYIYLSPSRKEFFFDLLNSSYEIHIFKENIKKIIAEIFSIKNENCHKVLRLFGLKLKFKNLKKIIIEQEKIIKDNNNCIENLLNELNNLKNEWAFKYDLYPPHCVSWFGSFKDYALEHNMQEIIKQMKYNLDDKSCNVLDLFLKRVMFLPDSTHTGEILFSNKLINSMYTQEETHWREKYEQILPGLSNEFDFLGNKILVETVYFHNGLKFCNEKMKEYIKNKDFIDGGAWIGDSVLIFNKYYSPRKIYSFEISKKLGEQYLQLMKANNIPQEKYEFVPYGLSDKIFFDTFNDTADSGTSVLFKGSESINLISIDEFAKDKDLNIGFLKIDVEGYGYEALKGSEEIIKKDRPIICLAVYHSPHEFFDSKPLLDEITKDLNYKIEYKQMQYRPYIAIEFVIWAYPAELGE